MKPALMYLVTNNINGKRYVGITTRKNVMRRFSEHICHAAKGVNNGAFYRALRKYGKDSFRIEILAHFSTVDDAKSAEIAYISSSRPEYNSTLGGDGRLGGAMSDEAKEKIRKIHTGNSYRRGKTHSLEVRNHLSKIGRDNAERFAMYSHLGPKAVRRPVLCVSTNEKFHSATEAAKKYGVARSALIELCLGKNGRKSVGGLIFKYIEAENAASR